MNNNMYSGQDSFHSDGKIAAIKTSTPTVTSSTLPNLPKSEGNSATDSDSPFK
jgi:hypothetical protein